MGITRNGRKFFGSLISNSYVNSERYKNQNNEVAVGRFGSTYNPYHFLGNSDVTVCGMDESVSSSAACALCLGIDDKMETLDDYFVGGTGLTSQKQSSIYHTENYMMLINNIVYNNTENDIIVKEVGLAAFSSDSSQSILLYRKVLSTPVTIKPDESYTFTLILK